MYQVYPSRTPPEVPSRTPPGCHPRTLQKYPPDTARSTLRTCSKSDPGSAQKKCLEVPSGSAQKKCSGSAKKSAQVEGLRRVLLSIPGNLLGEPPRTCWNLPEPVTFSGWIWGYPQLPLTRNLAIPPTSEVPSRSAQKYPPEVSCPEASWDVRTRLKVLYPGVMR
jgi:hypothetical protein